MKNNVKGFFLFAMFLAFAVCQLPQTQALAQSSYFTSRGCSGCHATPVVATCNGCHHHGAVSLKAATNKTSYTAGETVTATLTGGTRSGWFRAALYDETGTQIAVSNGNASGMGSSATFPAALTAPAPATAGTYTWQMGYYGNADGSGHSEVKVATNSFTVAAPAPPADTTAPVVTTFNVPATSSSLTVTGISIVATDSTGVTGYFLTESSSTPLASANGWSAAAPTSFTFATEGAKTLYAWAKDAAGNVSAGKSATVTVTLPQAGSKPALTVSALADGSYTKVQTLNISGQATDADGIKSVTVNGALVTIDQTGAFSSALTLSAGANTVTVVATDSTGSQSSDIRTITYDPTAPVLTLKSPADNGTSAQSFVTVIGTVNENSSVILTDNSGTTYTAAVTGNTFNATVNLADGINTITITATDLAGNTASAKRTITYQAAASMTLSITSPQQDITTKQKKVVFTGKITDATGKVSLKIKADKKTYKVSVSKLGTFKKTLTFKKPRLYAVTVTATDKAGHVSTATRNVIYSPEVEKDDDDNDDTPQTTPTTPAHPFGWSNPKSSHQNYVTSSNVASCTSCHSIDPASKGKPMSCFNCHGNEWGTPSTGGTTGGTTGGSTGGTATHPFGWTNPESSHPSYVEKNGTASCTACHSTAVSSKGQTMSCYKCHGKEW